MVYWISVDTYNFFSLALCSLYMVLLEHKMQDKLVYYWQIAQQIALICIQETSPACFSHILQPSPGSTDIKRIYHEIYTQNIFVVLEYYFVKCKYAVTLSVFSVGIYIYIYIHTHTHTHTYIYIYIYIYIHAEIFRCLCDLYSNYTGHKSRTSKHLKFSALYVDVVIIYLWWIYHLLLTKLNVSSISLSFV